MLQVGSSQLLNQEGSVHISTRGQVWFASMRGFKDKDYNHEDEDSDTLQGTKCAAELPQPSHANIFDRRII